MQIPKQHQVVMPYLILLNAEGFLDFAKKTFNAIEINKRMRDDEKTIMHAEIQIGGCTIMFAEATDQWGVQNTGSFLYVENADDTYEKALTNGATSVMGLSDQDYGRTCGVKDPTGNTW